MNWHRVVSLYAGIGTLATILTALLNPFFENKKLLRFTLLSAVITLILATLLVGELV